MIGEGTVNLESNINLTGRKHACINETISFYCVGGPGIEIVWDINATKLSFFNNQVELPDADYGNGVTAFVVNRKPVDNNTQYEYVSFALLRVSAGTQVVNVTCTVSPAGATNSSAKNLSVRVSG